MSATPLPAASEVVAAPKDSPPPTRLGHWLWVAAGLTIVWVTFLALITVQTANPPVVNVVQIQNSDFVLVGRWTDRAHGRFEVTQELKRGEQFGVITVTGVPERGMPTTETWVIPVVKFVGTYDVTKGPFINRPRQLPKDSQEREWLVQVHPQCYPATDDVLEQIKAALASARPLPEAARP